MKFGDDALDSAYDGVIEPVINEFGMQSLRIDKIATVSHLVNSR
jgi:hypothetical protein